MNLDISLKQQGIEAKSAFSAISRASSEQKNAALEALMKLLALHTAEILRANKEDIESAKKTGLSEALIDRLSLQGRLEGIISDLKQVINLKDPVGELFDLQTLENGLSLAKSRTALGVLGVIYESRPNVTIDVSALAIKSGNCAILRGGSETLRTNQVLVHLIQQALAVVQLPQHAIQLIPSKDRELVKELLKMHDYVDLIIPRGAEALHRFCRENSTIPVITGGIGVCHLFIDDSADLEKSVAVVLNAKTQRPTVCNALDTILVHSEVASSFIPRVLHVLGSQGVSFRLDKNALKIVEEAQIKDHSFALAQEGDWDTEWLSMVLGIKVISNIEEAIEHIKQHSTGHSDGILTQSTEKAQRFTKEVDSAAVYVNASTRFTDGGQLGLGAEVAISTQKIHARGPMGLKELTSYKWIIYGDYHIRP